MDAIKDEVGFIKMEATKMMNNNIVSSFFLSLKSIKITMPKYDRLFLTFP